MEIKGSKDSVQNTATNKNHERSHGKKDADFDNLGAGINITQNNYQNANQN